jgi:phosphoenolpyruvate---glycerone phosphotransferase subunit DhaL
MTSALDRNGLARLLRGAIGEVRASHEELSRLDSFGGDGDHGTTMLRAMAGMEKVLDARGLLTPGPLLHEVGWALMGIDGGATGPLLGTLFEGMAEAVGDAASLDASSFAAAFGSALAAGGKRTKARPGDKTLMDALVPAVDAMGAAVASGADFRELLRLGAEAARRGAESTAAMAARFGRARNVGAKSIGHPDPGATSISLILRGFLGGFESNG